MMSSGPGPQSPEGLLDEDDWFGDGSAFDSGEDLAAALMAFSGATAPEALTGAPVPTFEVAPFDQAAAAAAAMPAVPLSAPEFQVAELPGGSGRSTSSASGGRSWGTRPGGEKSGWGIRNSVKMLKTTEDVIRRLREDAVEVTWRAASVTFEYARR